MRLENIVWDARDPGRLGRFWTAVLGAEVITDESDLVEVRLELGPAGFLDLCFPRVAEPSTAPPRLHLDLRGGAVDVGRTPTDPEGGAFRVRDDPEGSGPIAALLLDSADPVRDTAFWAALTGWVPDGTSLRHPSGAGPELRLQSEPEPKRGKNRLHLDVRRDAGEGDVTGRLTALGARRLGGPPDLPWVTFADPSGNEFCVLAPSRPTG